MKICMTSYRSNPFSGGQGIYMRCLAAALRDLGHEVDFLSGQPYPIIDEGIGLIKLPSLDLYNGNFYRNLLINPLKLNTYPNFVEWFCAVTGLFSEPLAYGMRAKQYFKDNLLKKYDVVHDNQTLSYGIIEIQKMGYPLVETIHHPMTVDRDLALMAARNIGNRLSYRRWYSFIGMQIKVARQIPRIITVSETSKKHISEVFKVPLSNLKVIHNGIDTEIFNYSEDIERSDNTILMVMSRDTIVKGLRFLVEALAEVRQKHDMKVLVVGTTMGDGVIEDLMDKMNVTQHVQFLNRVTTEELVRLYQTSTLVAVPSTYEGFGLPVAEAMACGAPVVSTTAGALAEVVGDAGILVPPADSGALAKAICYLVENPDRRKELTKQGRNRILQNFNWRKAAKQTVEIYQEAIEEHKSLQGKA